MAGRGGFGRGELKPEIRLKLYNKAIRHFEKAKEFYETGQREAALREIAKATQVVRAFPEAYDLARKIHLELAHPKEASREEVLFQNYEGPKGASLYRLRDRLAQELELQKKFAPPPDVPFVPSLLVCGSLAAFLMGGMISEYRRLSQRPENRSGSRLLFLESFPDEEEAEVSAGWFFKLCALLLPGPSLFALLVLLGFRYYSDLFPVFLFSWVIVDGAVYFIFFADLSDLGGFRRPGAA